MASKLDDLLPAVLAAGDAGLSSGKITETFAGKSKAKDRVAEVRATLAALARDGAIWGPLKYRGTQHYFAAGRGPSIETASDAIVGLVARSGVKLLSKPGLEAKVTGMNKRFFADGLKHAVASQAILELSCGSSKYYLGGFANEVQHVEFLSRAVTRLVSPVVHCFMIGAAVKGDPQARGARAHP